MLQPLAIEVVAVAALELPRAVVGDRDGDEGVQGIEALLGRKAGGEAPPRAAAPGHGPGPLLAAGPVWDELKQSYFKGE